MSIDWLDAEAAIDTAVALRKRRAELEEILRQDPTDAGAAQQLLTVLDQLELDPPEIVSILQPAFEANPRDAVLGAWLAQLSYRLAQWKVAMVTAKHALAIDPHEPLANFTTGQLLLMATAHEDAFKHASRAWDSGQAVHYRNDIARLYCICLARMGKFEEAYRFQLERLAESPDETQVVIDTADLLMEMGRTNDATILLEKTFATKPRDTDLLFRLAVGAFELNDLAAARRWADKLLKTDPQHLEGWNLRGQVRLKQGEYEGALADHGMISELSRSIPLDQSFRAQCLVALNRRDEAVAALKQGIEEARDMPELQQRYKSHLQTLESDQPEA